jgi:hypothetical protein
MTDRTFALLSSQGTACSETALTESEYANPSVRAHVEAEFCSGKPDAPLPDTWTDVTDNEAIHN